jgi:DNA polymerase-4
MSRERSIIHLNVADFAVAVERVVDTSLQNRPVIVAPLQAARAAVYDMSEEAYTEGVRKGMLLRQASRLCRTARVLVPRPELYRRAMQAVVAEAREYTPVVEHGVEDGHLFLDLSGTHRLFGAAPDVGWRLRKQVRDKLRIEPIWSLAANKLVSKVASRLVKPVGEYIVAPGEEELFLTPLPLSLLPGIELDERRRLLEFNIRKVGQLASLDRTQLYAVFGQRGDSLYEISHGIDDDLVMGRVHQAPAISSEHIFADDTGDYRELEATVSSLAVQTGMELRAARLAGRRMALCLHYTDGSQTTRQASVRRGRSDDFSLRKLALLALQRAMTRRVRVRSCRLICDRLCRQSPQLSLFPEPDPADAKREKLCAALDVVRNRYGRTAVRFGSQATLH